MVTLVRHTLCSSVLSTRRLVSRNERFVSRNCYSRLDDPDNEREKSAMQRSYARRTHVPRNAQDDGGVYSRALTHT